MLKRKVVIIGGSAAGPAAAAKAKRVNPKNEVILYEQGPYISIGTCELPYVLSGEIESVEKIVFFTPESFEAEKGAKVKINHRVESIDKHKKKIFVRDLSTQKMFEDNYDKLILCTGSRKKYHPNFQQVLENVFYLKTVNDARKILNFISENKISRSLLIGAGYTGLESLEFLKKISNEIYVADVSLYPLPGFDLEVQKILLNEIQDRGITFLGNAKNIYPIVKNNRVVSVKIDKELIEIDFVLITIGYEPNSSLASLANLSINPDGSIRVDDKQRTSDDNIYAAGDCSSVKEFITKKNVWIPLATYAHNHGHIAGANAAGEPSSSYPVVRNMGFRFFDLSIAQVGLTQKELNESKFNWATVSAIGSSRIKVMPKGKKHFIKVYFNKENKKILSASLIGGEDIIGKANLISFAIKNNVTIDKFFNSEFLYTPSLSPFIESLSIISNKAREIR